MNLSKLLPFKPAPRTEVAKCFGVQLARVGIRHGELITLECTEDIKPGDFVIAQWQSVMLLAEVRPLGWLRVDFASDKPPLHIPPGTARIRGRVGRAVNKLDVPKYIAPLN